MRRALSMAFAALAAAGALAASPTELPPANATLLHSARVWELRGRSDLARLALEKLAAARPESPECLLELGELELRAGNFAAARTLLVRLRATPAGARAAEDLDSAYRLAGVDRLELQAIRRRLETGRRAEALAALHRLFPAGAPGGAAGLEYYALLAATPGGWEPARAGLEALAHARPQDPRPRLALAKHLATRPATAPAALTMLALLSRRDDLDPREVAAARAGAQLALGPAASTIPAVAAAAPAAPAEPGPAVAQLARAAELDGRAQLEFAAGDLEHARADFDAALKLAPDDPWIRYRRARHYAADADPEQGRALIAAGRQQHPDDVDLRYAEALYLSAIDEPATALAAATAIAAAERSPGIEALIARLEARHAAPAPTVVVPPSLAARDGWIAAGVAHTDKPGDPGVSALRSLLLPFEWHLGAAVQDLSVRADAVRLDPGRLPRAFEAAAAVGTVAAAGPAAVAGLDAGHAVSGLAVGAAYRNSLLSADLGTTPLGFPVVSAVGGLRLTPSVGPVDFAVGVARRPVTGSVLSYAGRADPVSGKVWGGVTETGPSLQVGRWEEHYSISGSVRVSWLNGRHVLANHYTGARFAAEHQLIDRARAGADVDVGIAVSYWSYAHSLLGYTYGSGGYYSPQSYWSIAAPLEFSGQRAGWSLRARTAIAVTASSTARAAYFPLDAALAATAAAVLGRAPAVAASHSSGISVSLFAAAERALGEHLVIGAALDLDRTDFYHPTTLLLYLRHALGAAPMPVSVPPRPLRAYADF